MNCCHAQTEQRPRHSWWRSASGCVGSGTLLVLLPKCPICIAAYLALWTGAGVAMPIAAHLRPLLEIVFVALMLLPPARYAITRSREAEQKRWNKT